ncbi:MAG: hypothetical protein WCA12_20145, partial [Burkholderiales bacterium]
PRLFDDETALASVPSLVLRERTPRRRTWRLARSCPAGAARAASLGAQAWPGGLQAVAVLK